MRTVWGLIGVAAMVGLSPCAGAQSVPAPSGTDASREHMQLFIAPCGRPYRAARGEAYPVGKWFAEADTNHDGRLTEFELRADALRFFDQLDVDHDHLLEPAEVERYETEIAPEVRSSGDWSLAAPSLAPLTGANGGTMLIRASYSDDQDAGAQSEDGDEHPYHPIGSYQGSMRGAARYSLIPRPEPVTAANIDMRIDIRPSDFEMQASADFDALDRAHKGFLLLTDLPETAVQHKGLFGSGK